MKFRRRRRRRRRHRRAGVLWPDVWRARARTSVVATNSAPKFAAAWTAPKTPAILFGASRFKSPLGRIQVPERASRRRDPFHADAASTAVCSAAAGAWTRHELCAHDGGGAAGRRHRAGGHGRGGQGARARRWALRPVVQLQACAGGRRGVRGERRALSRVDAPGVRGQRGHLVRLGRRSRLGAAPTQVEGLGEERRARHAQGLRPGGERAPRPGLPRARARLAAPRRYHREGRGHGHHQGGAPLHHHTPRHHHPLGTTATA